MDSDIKAQVRKLRRLVQYRDASDEQLEKIAQKNVVLSELVNSGNFIDEKEKSLAKKIFEAYLSKTDFDNYSDLQTLSILVYNEILLQRIQATINKSVTKDGSTYINDKIIKSMHEVENQIGALKNKLGIDKEVKENEFSALQLLKKRFAAWINENKNEMTLYVPFECGSCGKQDVKPVLLRKRVKDFDVLEHPHLSGRFWYNKYAMDMVKAGKLSPSDYAGIFSTSTDYVAWCLANEGRILTSTKTDGK